MNIFSSVLSEMVKQTVRLKLVRCLDTLSKMFKYTILFKMINANLSDMSTVHSLAIYAMLTSLISQHTSLISKQSL